ncbi:hypothetical protein [Nostoc sp.]
MADSRARFFIEVVWAIAVFVKDFRILNLIIKNLVAILSAA